MSWNDSLEMNRDLIVLIRERLGGPFPEYNEVASQVHEKKANAAMVGGQILAQGHLPTFRLLGKIFGVSPSTVKRWFGPGEFEKETKLYSTWFNPDEYHA